ncbi:MAG TPA: AbrB/MazE/SpoVT family DNA-binding domain-containing protein [Leucothrix mucor]|nr:AbrB/MazE/SpoVT family DNA-binding domain-containing protein [Leucothrix mucor]
MPKISAKRQITLPIQQCKQLGLEAGDEYISFVFNGRITIIKKVATAAKGFLKHIKGDASISDQESMQDGMDLGQTT